ncbi:hypothetical protein VDGL01_11447 [Verticillium dahliae]
MTSSCVTWTDRQPYGGRSAHNKRGNTEAIPWKLNTERRESYRARSLSGFSMSADLLRLDGIVISMPGSNGSITFLSVADVSGHELCSAAHHTATIKPQQAICAARDTSPEAVLTENRTVSAAGPACSRCPG